MALLYFKALHVIGFVAWFAGLFYWLRIFVYLAEARTREEPARGILWEQFTKMERRVYAIIVRPGAGITLVGGVGMLVAQRIDAGQWFYLQEGWLLSKLALVAGLLGFQAFAKTYIAGVESGRRAARPERLRMMNEVPTVFLLVIVLLAVLRNGLDALTAVAIVVGFVIFLGAGIRYYRGIPVAASIALRRRRQRR